MPPPPTGYGRDRRISSNGRSNLEHESEHRILGCTNTRDSSRQGFSATASDGTRKTLTMRSNEHTIADWLAVHKIEREAILEGIDGLHFKFATHDKQVGKGIGMSRDEVLETLVIPSLTRLLGPDVLTSVLDGMPNFIRCSKKAPPYTLDVGCDQNPKIHVPWRGAYEDVVWMTHEVAHAVQIRLSEHHLMPPIARETCAFWAELTLLNHSEIEHPNVAVGLRSVWRQHTRTYLGRDLNDLKVALKDPCTPYHYSLNYPLARLSSLFLSRQSSASHPKSLFSSGRRAMDLICCEELLLEFQDRAKRHRNLSDSAATEILLHQVEEKIGCQSQLTLSTLLGEEVVRDQHLAAVPGMNRWRSIGIQAIAALKSGRGNVTPCEFLEGLKGDACPRSDSAAHESFDAFAAIGLAVHHLSQSTYHRNFKLSYYLPVEILPAIKTGQLETFVLEDGTPVGLVTWARLSKSSEKDIFATGRALRECEWRSGTRLFFNDWITERSAFRRIVRELSSNVFPHDIASSLRRNQNGTVRRINRWRGKFVNVNCRDGNPDANAKSDGSLAAATCCARVSKRRACTCSSTLPTRNGVGSYSNKGTIK